MKITVLAKTGAKTQKIEKISDVEYRLWVHKQPEGGQANVAIIKTLAEYFDVPKTSIGLVSGQKSKIKVFEIPL